MKNDTTVLTQQYPHVLEGPATLIDVSGRSYWPLKNRYVLPGRGSWTDYEPFLLNTRRRSVGLPSAALLLNNRILPWPPESRKAGEVYAVAPAVDSP